MKLPGNMQKMMQQAQQMQQQLQEEIAQIRVEASTGGGMVTVKMDGQKKVLSIDIDEEVLEDREMLQDMVRGAVNEGRNRCRLCRKLFVRPGRGADGSPRSSSL